ncbi:MAG: CHAT domain-containing protein [Spirochaetota bacterium]
MAYLIYTDPKNLRASLQWGRVRLPRTEQGRYDLGRVRRGELLFLVDYENGELYGPFFCRSTRVRLEKNPRTGPFNGVVAGPRYLYQSIDIDCARSFPGSLPVNGLGLEQRPFCLDRESSRRIFESLSYRNRPPGLVVLDLQEEPGLLKATVVHSSLDPRGALSTSIHSREAPLDVPLLASIGELRRRGDRLLGMNAVQELVSVLEELGCLVHGQVLARLLDGIHDRRCSLHVRGVGRALDIPLELAHDRVFLFRKRVLSFGIPDGVPEGGCAGRVRLGRALIVADPDRRFPRAYEEGEMLYGLFRKEGLEAHLVSRPLDRETLLRAARGCGLVHFAGHARGEPPAWDLGRELLQVSGLPRTAAGVGRVPPLVFSSCCGDTLPLGAGLLRAGAVNVIATRWRRPDRDMGDFISEFYGRLLSGQQIGYAFHRSQAACFPADPLCGLFLLMGESRVVYETAHS